MKKEFNCPNCHSTQISLQKRGFSLSIALISFLLITFLLIYIWMQIFKSQDYENAESYRLAVKFHWEYKSVDWVNNKALWIGTLFLLAFSLLGGLIGAQKNKIVCLNCGQIKKLSKSNVELQQG